MTRKTRIVTLALAAGIAATGLIALAGDLNPPPGAVAPTHKTLTEVEPRTAINAINTPGDADSLFQITQPGSYYLTGNVTGVVGKHGIEIVASGVTIDLNGFDLAGVPAMGAFDGVRATSSVTNVAVVNGAIRSWGNAGVDLQSSGATHCRIEGVLASGNANHGIRVGSSTTVSNCSVTASITHGISTREGCTIYNCTAYSNGTYGIATLTGSTLSNCTAYSNGSYGINTSNGCTVSNCSAYSNTGTGISAGGGCTVSNCSAHQNGSSGIGVGNGSTVSNCSAYSNTGSGITTSISNGCTISNCSAVSNNVSGINAGSACTVADCTVQLNTIDGIRCASNCVVRGNTCGSNGNGLGDGAGIHATSADNRIEGNTCTLADRGIDVDAAGNLIIRNTCSGNTTNWDVVAGNVILVINATTAAAVTGNSGGAAPGSTDPNANFTY